MAEQPRASGRLLADRLDHLFRTVHPKDRGPFTPAEVAEAVNKAAGDRVISKTRTINEGGSWRPIFWEMITARE